jgi:hypothetical protein
MRLMKLDLRVGQVTRESLEFTTNFFYAGHLLQIIQNDTRIQNMPGVMGTESHF